MLALPSVAICTAVAALLGPRCAWGANNQSAPLYKNPNADIEDRVNDLLGRMTIEEKVAQM